MSTPLPLSTRRKITWVAFQVVGHLLCLMGLVAYPLVVGSMAFFFDAPGAVESISTWSLVLSITTYPVFYGYTLWLTFRERKSLRFITFNPMLVWIAWVVGHFVVVFALS